MTHPKKPERNPSHLAFPQRGPVRQVIEQFPREQNDLELTVGRKFLGALQHFQRIQLTDLCRGEEPADLVCQAEDGTPIGLQIVEAIDEPLRRLRAVRASYQEGVVRQLGNRIILFNGCRVSIVDSGDPPYLPDVRTVDGQACLQAVAAHVLSVAEDASTLLFGKTRLRNLNVTPLGKRIWVLLERSSEPTDPPRLELSWSGSGPSYPTDVSRGVLAGAVRTKVEKNYMKPRGQRFVLVAYSVDTLMREDDPDANEARQVLDRARHPFDDVWYFFPYAELTLGHLIHVWPYERGG